MRHSGALHTAIASSLTHCRASTAMGVSVGFDAAAGPEAAAAAAVDVAELAEALGLGAASGAAEACITIRSVGPCFPAALAAAAAPRRRSSG